MKFVNRVDVLHMGFLPICSPSTPGILESDRSCRFGKKQNSCNSYKSILPLFCTKKYFGPGLNIYSGSIKGHRIGH